MARPLQLSLLDRLSDEPSQQKINYALRIRQSIRRDLEALLNSKIHWQVWPQWYEELDESLYRYGLPDFSSMPLSSQDGRDKLCAIIETAIRTFEPRLTAISVETIDQEQPIDRILRLRIKAFCRGVVDPEEMVFDSEIEPVSLGVTVSG